MGKFKDDPMFELVEEDGRPSYFKEKSLPSSGLVDDQTERLIDGHTNGQTNGNMNGNANGHNAKMTIGLENGTTVENV